MRAWASFFQPLPSPGGGASWCSGPRRRKAGSRPMAAASGRAARAEVVLAGATGPRRLIWPMRLRLVRRCCELSGLTSNKARQEFVGGHGLPMIRLQMPNGAPGVRRARRIAGARRQIAATAPLCCCPHQKKTPQDVPAKTSVHSANDVQREAVSRRCVRAIRWVMVGRCLGCVVVLR